MKSLIVLSLVLLLISCGVQTPYEAFRKENKEDVAMSFGVSSFVVNTLVWDKDFRAFKKQVSGIKKYHLLVSRQSPLFIKANFDVFLKKNNFKEIFHLTKDHGVVRIFSSEKGEQMKEVVVEIENGSEMVLVKVQGNLKINDFQKLTAFND
jgi:hypothetical protein